MTQTNYLRVAAVLLAALAASVLVLAGMVAEMRPAEATATQTWDLENDFRLAPNEANPSPDSYGNADVWHYMRSSDEARDAATYSLLGRYGVAPTTPAEGWLSPEGENAYDIPFVVKRSSDGRILVHPTASPESNSVVGWRSPITGTISISGEIRDGHVGCCDGVDWYIHRGSDESLASGTIRVGGAESFSRPSLTNIRVTEEEFIYLVVHPHDTSYEDTTELDLTISGDPDPPAPSTPDLDTASDRGASSTDDVTNDTTPTFTGTAEEGSTVKILVDGVEKGSGTATSGSYSITTSELGDGSYDITATATDEAGNTSSASAPLENVIIDSEGPGITLTAPASNASYKLNQSLTASYSCADEPGGSGLDSCVGTVTDGSTIDTSSAALGFHTFKVDAKDKAGNTASKTHAYGVVYDFSGFFQPINNKDENGDLIANEAKAGSSIPVKFSLSGNQGLDIFEAGYPVSKEVSCPGQVATDALEEYATDTTSGLKYDADVDQYNYTWKTEAEWSGTCRLLTVKLADDTIHEALFWFNK